MTGILSAFKIGAVKLNLTELRSRWFSLRGVFRAISRIFFCYALFFMFDVFGIFYHIDKTLSPSYYLEYSKSNSSLLPPVYLVSYANKETIFFKNQNAQAMSAINNGIDYIMMYKNRDIDVNFYKKNKHILDIPKGDGLWIWKPYFILKTMKTAPEDSVIIYADSPVVFKKPITPFIKLLEKYDILLLLAGTHRKKNVLKAGSLIKEEFCKSFGINYDEFQKKDNIWACFVVVRNNQTGRSFIEQWMKNCENDLITSIHGADQAMLLIAAYQKPNGIYVVDVDEAMEVIKNVHRHPNDMYKSLLPDMVSGNFKWFKISEFGYNSQLAKWARSFLE